MANTNCAVKIATVRELAGIGLQSARDFLERCDGDVLLAVGYAKYEGLAVSVRGDREAWNMANAKAWKREYLEVQEYRTMKTIKGA